MRLVYGDHPYGHSASGSEASLVRFSGDDVRRFHERMMRRSSLTLIAVGDCEPEEIERLARDAFAGWGSDDGSRAGDVSLPQPVRRLALVPRPGAPQSELRIGHVAVPRSTPDYHALITLNTILGGQFVSRINLNLREHKGFTYGARTTFDFRRMAGPFVLQTSVQTQSTGDAIAESIDEISAIRGARPVSDAERALGVAALTRGYARNFETADQVARAVAQLALYSLPDDYFTTFVARVEATTVDELTRAAARHLDPARATVVVVGDAERVGPSLASRSLGAPEILATDAF
jgi:predicted Zn-dependent peptidase